MSKKTPAYSEGYAIGQANAGSDSNPYSETEQLEQYTDFRSGYADGLLDRESDIDPGIEEDYEDSDEDYEEEDVEEEEEN